MPSCWLVFSFYIINIVKYHNIFCTGKYGDIDHLITSCDFLDSRIQESTNMVVLKKKHAYYAQVQLGMYILNLEECDFVIYSGQAHSLLNVTVKFDIVYVRELVQKLQYNFFNYMLHEICLNRYQK